MLGSDLCINYFSQVKWISDLIISPSWCAIWELIQIWDEKLQITIITTKPSKLRCNFHWEFLRLFFKIQYWRCYNISSWDWKQLVFGLFLVPVIWCDCATRDDPCAGQAKLEWLSLDNNSLSTVSQLSFTPLATINGLYIQQNPWNCTCQLKPFLKVKTCLSWLLKRFWSNIHGSRTFD